MRSNDELVSQTTESSDKELRLLSELGRSPESSQRTLSQRLGIALGLTNLLLRSLAEKGYIRISQAGWKRWLYNLTPAGVTRKMQLTVDYIHRFLGYYSSVKRNLREQLEPLALNEESRIAIYGTGEFAELVYLGLRDMGIEEIEVFHTPGNGDSRFLGMPVRDITTLRAEDYDRVVLAFLKRGDAGINGLEGLYVPADKLVKFFNGIGPSEEA